MQAGSISANASEILMRDTDRERIQRQVDAFLESKEITVLSTRLAPIRETTYAFNTIIATAPSKQRMVADDKENVEILVKRFSTIEMHGVRIRRSAPEVARLMRERGYKLRGPSVQRVAQSIGVKLRQ